MSELTAALATIEKLRAERDQLAAENAALTNFITQSCYVFDGEQHEISDAYICATDGGMPETLATNAAIAGIKAEGAEACVSALVTSDDDDFADAPNICAEVARLLREGAK